MGLLGTLFFWWSLPCPTDCMTSLDACNLGAGSATGFHGANPKCIFQRRRWDRFFGAFSNASCDGYADGLGVRLFWDSAVGFTWGSGARWEPDARCSEKGMKQSFQAHADMLATSQSRMLLFERPIVSGRKSIFAVSAPARRGHKVRSQLGGPHARGNTYIQNIGTRRHVVHATADSGYFVLNKHRIGMG